MKDPTCPEHGGPMRYEAQANWWVGRCGCSVRVFDESKATYVPASSITPPRRVPGGQLLWWPRRHSITTWHRLEYA